MIDFPKYNFFKGLNNSGSLCQVIRNHCCTLKKLKGGYAFVCINGNYYIASNEFWFMLKPSQNQIVIDPFGIRITYLVTSAASSLWLKSKNILQKYYLWMFLFFDYSVLKNNPLYLNPFSRVEKQVKWAQGVGFPTVWIFWWHHIYIALCAKNCKLAGKNP